MASCDSRVARRELRAAIRSSANIKRSGDVPIDRTQDLPSNPDFTTNPARVEHHGVLRPADQRAVLRGDRRFEVEARRLVDRYLGVDLHCQRLFL